MKAWYQRRPELIIFGGLFINGLARLFHVEPVIDPETFVPEITVEYRVTAMVIGLTEAFVILVSLITGIRLVRASGIKADGAALRIGVGGIIGVMAILGSAHGYYLSDQIVHLPRKMSDEQIARLQSALDRRDLSDKTRDGANQLLTDELYLKTGEPVQRLFDGEGFRSYQATKTTVGVQRAFLASDRIRRRMLIETGIASIIVALGLVCGLCSRVQPK